MSGIGTNATALAVAVTAAAETVVLTIPFSAGNSLNSSLANAPGVGKPSNNRIAGAMDLLAGTGTTAVVTRCRQGSLTGAVVGVLETDTLAATNTGAIPFDFKDTASGYAQAYVITVQQTGGTANGTVNYINGCVTDFN
jgi:hypothetical protein